MITKLFLSLFVLGSLLNAYSYEYEYPASQINLSVNALYQEQKENLSNSSIYFFVTAYKQEKFAPNLARSLKLNYSRLNEFGVDFQIRLTCDGRIEDQTAFSDAFKNIDLSPENYQIKLNEQNKGVSLTRFEQLVNSRDEIMDDMSKGRNVYFSLFDGDDMIHQDYCLLLQAIALKVSADIVGTEFQSVRCSESDISKIEELQVKSLETISFGEVEAGDFCTSLFKADSIFLKNLDLETILKRDAEFSETYFDKNISFRTLSPLMSKSRFKRQYAIQKENCCLSSSPFVSDVSFTPLFFYMQHSDSMEHNLIRDGFFNLARILNAENSYELLHEKFIPQFLFGEIECIHERMVKGPEFNIGLTEETLLDYFKYNHKIAHILKDEPEISKLEKVQELLAQDPEKPLSREFMQVFYRDVFDVMLGLKPIPHDSSLSTNSD